MAWRHGTTRLLDYGAAGAPVGALPLLVIPSLINRAYVLDLSERASLMRWLAAPGEGRGFRPFLVDWGAPGTGERRFDLTRYIAGRLARGPARSSADRRSVRGRSPRSV